MTIFDWLMVGYNRRRFEETVRETAHPLNQVLEQIRRDQLTPAERAVEDAERQRIAAYHKKVAKTEQLLAALFLIGFTLFVVFAMVMASLQEEPTAVKDDSALYPGSIAVGDPSPTPKPTPTPVEVRRALPPDAPWPTPPMPPTNLNAGM